MEKIEVEALCEKYSKLELAEKLAYYKRLDRDGYVYYRTPPEGYYCLVGLIQLSTGIPDYKLKELLKMNFERTSNIQKRSIKKYNRNSALLSLAKNLSITYIREHNGEHCPRVKNSKNTTDILNAKSGLKNFYPLNYVKYVTEFLKKYPIEKWGEFELNSNIEDFEIYEIDDNDNITYICNRCGHIMKKKSRYIHRKNHCHSNDE